MSITIVTMGKFFCKGTPSGGGAVITKETEDIKPRILVTKIESKEQKEKLSIDIIGINNGR